MGDLFADSWASVAWDLIAPAVPTFGAILILGFAVRIVWAGGIISFAPIAIAATGGYLAANLVVAGAGLGLAVLAGCIIGFWLGLLLAMLLGRLPAQAQTLATLAIAALIGPVSRLVPAWTGGADGISIAALVPPGGPSAVIVSLALVAVVVVAGAALDRSWFAIAARAVRHNGALATGMGIHPNSIQIIGCGLSGLLAGLAGAMMVLGAGIAAPATFQLSLGFLAVAAVLLGGAFHWAGPILGSLIFALPAALQGAVTPGLLDIANALAVIVLLIFLPRGLLDPRDSLRREARERRRQSRATGFTPPADDDRRRSSSRHGLQSGHASRLNSAIKRRTGGPR